MALLIIAKLNNIASWVKYLQQQDSTLDIRVWPDEGNPDDIDFVLVWQHPHGQLNKYRNLKCIHSIGAGVDHILNDPHLPTNIPIAKVVDPLLTRDMSQYVILATLHIMRLFDTYETQQKQKIWQQQKPNNEITVGIMGIGKLGQDAALKLHSLGIHVIGWSRNKKNIEGLKTFHGNTQLKEFLQQSHILINLLPLTPETENILNNDLFMQLPKGAYIINSARGKHLVEEDLINALNEGHLAGAYLDVFRIEPLPADHSFWQHPKIKITPHIASVTNPKSVAKQVVENYHRMQNHQPLFHIIDPDCGY